MSSRRPFFFLLPGVGLGLRAGGTQHALPIKGDIRYVKRVAAALSDFIVDSHCSLQDERAVDDASHLFAKWRDAGGVRPHPRRIRKSNGDSCLSASLLDLSEHTMDYRSRNCDLDWAGVEEELQSRGYRLQLRDDHAQPPPFVVRLRSMPIYEVITPDGDVLAEGKGLDSERSRKSALAEAVERLIAASPVDASAIACATPRYLHSSNELFPELDYGPRDLYSEDLCLDWQRAFTYDGRAAWLPAESIYLQHAPLSGVAGIALKHSTGLASGATLGEAFANALLEVLERDAYWITMRCRLRCPDVTDSELDSTSVGGRNLVRYLKASGIAVHVKWVSLDWPIPIAHTLLVDEQDRMPAFSHGLGAGLSRSVALTRSVTEAVQVHSGLARTAASEWQRIVEVDGVLGEAALAWCDPLFRPHVQHLMRVGQESHAHSPHIVTQPSHRVRVVSELCEYIERQGHRIFWTCLGELCGLTVVRVVIEDVVSPDYRLERTGKRFHTWVERETSHGAYSDPILT